MESIIMQVIDKYLIANQKYLDDKGFCSNCGDDVCPHTHKVDMLINIKEDISKIDLTRKS